MSKLLQKCSLLLFGLMIMSQFLMAQTRKISGKVTDSNGKPIKGVTIKIKGTNTGTTSNSDGTYIIGVNAPNSKLVFSSVGFLPSEKTTTTENVNVVLTENDNTLAEVVVTGALGIKKNIKSLGYSTAFVKGEELTRTNTINPITALQGKVAGVNITVPSANGIQSSPYIQIRGAKVLGGNNQPIFVIDGNVITNNISNADNTDAGSQFKNFNPDDYESIEILKGAAATSLYGSRGINGAVVITTKKGKSGNGLGIEITSTYQTQQIYRAPMAFQNDYGQGSWNTAEGNFRPDGSAAQTNYSFGPKYDGSLHPAVHNANILVPYVAQPNNWRTFYQNGGYINNNIALSGANDKFNYRFSYSNNYTKGLIPNNDLKRNSIDIKAGGQLNKVFSSEFGLQYANSITRNMISQGRYFYSGGQNLGFNTYYLPRNLDTKTWYKTYRGADNSIIGSTYGNLQSVTNAFSNFDNNNTYRHENSVLGYTQFKAQVNDWIDLTARGNINFYKIYTETKNKGNEINNLGGLYSSSGSYTTSYTFLFTAHAKRDFLNKDLVADLRLINEIYGDRLGESSGSSTNGGLAVPNRFFLSNSVNNVYNVNNINYGVTYPSARTIGAAADLNLAYKNFLFLELTGRNDWVSSLTYPSNITGAANNYSVFYPSANLSYQFYDQLKNKLPKWLSAGQLRASLSYVGSVGVASSYSTNQGFTPGNLYDINGSSVGYASQYQADIKPNLNLKPQVQRSIELGTNLAFLDNLINFDFTWYKTNTLNQLLNLPYVPETGFSKIYFNAGNIQNQGIETTIGISPIRKNKDWALDLNLVFSRNRGKIVKFGQGIKEWALGDSYDGAIVMAYEGGDYGVLSSENSSSIKLDPKSGLPLITVGQVQSSDDALDKFNFQQYNYVSYDANQGRAKIGNVQPNLMAGFNGTLRYKAFSLFAQADGSFGQWIYSEALNYAMAQGTPLASLQYRDQAHGGIARIDSYNGQTRYDGAIPNVVFADGQISPLKPGVNIGGLTFREAYDAGLVAPWKAAAYYNASYGYAQNINSPQNMSTAKNSWIMLREITFGYSIPSKITNKLKIRGARISVTARNIGYLYKTLPGGQNPESLQSNNPFNPYITGGVPFSRSYSATLNFYF